MILLYVLKCIIFPQGKTTPQKITSYIKPMKYKNINNK
jgi:hypothetical protein